MPGDKRLKRILSLDAFVYNETMEHGIRNMNGKCERSVVAHKVYGDEGMTPNHGSSAVGEAV